MKGARGMTLVELLVVIVVASIIGLAVINMFITSNRTFMDQNKVIDMQRDGRLVMENLARMVREAGLNPLGRRNGGQPIAGIEAGYVNKIRVSRDADMSGAIETGAMERVSFFYDAGRKVLLRGFDEATPAEVWRDLAANVSAFSFRYLDALGAEVITPAEDPDKLASIRAVEIAVSFEDTKFMGGDFTREYLMRVDLRNR